MGRRLYLRNCESGDLIDDVFVVNNVQFASGQNGKNYIKALLSDHTCQLPGRMWNANRQIFETIPESGFVKVRGHVENYQNALQVIIEQIWPAKPGTFELGDLIPTTTKDVQAMCTRLHEILGSIQNRHLSALMQVYLDDDNLMGQFCKAPAAQSFHHAFIGGLLEHTLNALEVADAVVKFYPLLNRDLVIAGIFLHDIAKTWELTYECAFGYSDGGHLVGHIVKSAIWVEQKRAMAEEMLGEPIPQALIDVLQHIILAHHGEAEFGSPKVPATPEALAVHAIENMDAKLTMALHACRGNGVKTEGNWTEYLKAFNTRMYRPGFGEEPAPADAPPPSDNGQANDPPALTITNPLFETTPAQKK
jgi:3'-5' exoribonuclease